MESLNLAIAAVSLLAVLFIVIYVFMGLCGVCRTASAIVNIRRDVKTKPWNAPLPEVREEGCVSMCVANEYEIDE